jgi:hypothetical protein
VILDSSLTLLIYAGIFIFSVIQAFRGLQDPGRALGRMALYLLVFFAGVTAMEAVFAMHTEKTEAFSRCIASASVINGVPAYFSCSGYVIPGTFGTGGFEDVTAIREYLVHGTSAFAVYGFILLKLKMDLAKASFTGPGPLAFAFFTAAMTGITLTHASTILAAFNEIIGSFGRLDESKIRCAFEWIAGNHAYASSVAMSGGVMDRVGAWLRILMLNGIQISFFGMGVVSLILHALQSLGLVLLPFLLLIALAMGVGGWKFNLTVIGFIAVVGLFSGLQALVMQMTVSNNLCEAVPRMSSLGEMFIAGGEASTATLSSIQMPVGDAAYQDMAGFVTKGIGIAFSAIVGTLVGGLALVFGGVVFLTKALALVIANALGAQRMANSIEF